MVPWAPPTHFDLQENIMRTYVQRGLYGVLLAGGFVVLGAGAATAADLSTTSDAEAASGLGAIITAPLPSGTTSGSIIEEAVVSLDASLDLGAGTGSGDGLLGDSTLGPLDGGVANADQVAPQIAVPVNVSGNSVSVIGDSSSTGTSGARGTTASDPS